MTRLKLPSSGCVHFMYADFFCGEAEAVLDDLRSAGIRCVYVDYRNIEGRDDLHIANALARELNLQHAPYPPPASPAEVQVWVPFLDDLITLSGQEKGVVLFVDGADLLAVENSRAMFRLIEAFLIQVHHWMEKKKPCHLCFQMEPDDSLRAQFVISGQ
jgi:hypothetical protein